MLCLLYIYCFFPLFSPVDPETAADVPVIDYVIDDTSSLSAEVQASPSFDHPDIAHFLSLMLALDFSTIIVCSYSDA